MPTPRFYTTAEVAKILGVSTGTARYYVNVGHIKSVRLGNGPRAQYRIPETALVEWAKRNET